MKKYIIPLLCISAVTYPASYKSTQEALTDILNTGNSILHASTIYDHEVINTLRILSQKLDSYVMGKQGILVGKLSKGNATEQDNIFDIWHKALYNRVDMLIEILESIMTKGRSKKYPTSSITQLEAWETSKTFEDEVIKKAQKIYKSAILDQKKKAAEITIFFAEHIVDIIKKAIKDYNSK